MRLAAAFTGLILVGGGSAATAQERHFGAKLGPNFTVLSLDAEDFDESYDRRIAIAGGGFVVVPVSRHLAVQTEMLFSPKGAKLFSEDIGATSTLLLDYLEFPVLARFDSRNSRSFHVFAGPYAGIRVGAKRQLSASARGFSAGYVEDMGREVERFDFGLVAGGGMHFGRRTVVDARYSWGLTNVNADMSEGIQFRNRVLTVMAGLRF